MTELFRETVNAAERVLAGEDVPVHDYLERLIPDTTELQSGGDEGRAYLALLLDSIGLQGESIRVLRDSAAAGQSSANAALQNVEGILAALHGRYQEAQN